MTCTHLACPHPVHASGLCRAHYGQRQRGTPLRPLRPRGGLVRVEVRLPPALVKALRKEGAPLAAAIRSMLSESRELRRAIEDATRKLDALDAFRAGLSGRDEPCIARLACSLAEYLADIRATLERTRRP